MNLLPIPWMKQKLEVLYEANLYGNLYIMYTDLNFKNYTNITTSILLDLLDDCNINVDNNNPLYIYLPLELDFFTSDLIVNFKSLFKENLYIILGGYKNKFNNDTELDIVEKLYIKYPQLNNLIDYAYLIDDSKCYEIFTSLSDTQRVYIKPESSCTISGLTLNYHLKNLNPTNVNHLAFVNLMDECENGNFLDCYIKGFTNNNNNFNYNL